MGLKVLLSFLSEFSGNDTLSMDRPPSALTQKFHIIIGGLLAFMILWLDLALPLGVAAGVPYLFLVLLAWWAPNKKFFYYAAVAGTILTLIGLAFSPAGGEMWKVLSNRFLALVVIWGTAFLGVVYKSQTEELASTNEKFKEEIRQRKRAEENLKNSESRLRELCAHMETVRENERFRVAREIHDELGQVLTTLKLEIAVLEDGLPKDSDQAQRNVASLLTHTDSAIQTVKKISGELRPFALDNLGLLEGMQWEIEKFEKRTNIKCELDLGFDDSHLALDLSITIFRIFQEALTNVIRYAEADKLSLTLKEEKRCIHLVIVDNGKGIPEHRIRAKDAFGLMGMRERAHAWGGEFTIKGTPGKGTEIRVHIPLENTPSSTKAGDPVAAKRG